MLCLVFSTASARAATIETISVGTASFSGLLPQDFTLTINQYDLSHTLVAVRLVVEGTIFGIVNVSQQSGAADTYNVTLTGRLLIGDPLAPIFVDNSLTASQDIVIPSDTNTHSTTLSATTGGTNTLLCASDDCSAFIGASTINIPGLAQGVGGATGALPIQISGSANVEGKLEVLYDYLIPDPSDVPEPFTATLAGGALALLWAVRRHQRSLNV